MMRGVYDIAVRPGTFQEVALVFREVRDKRIQYQTSVASMGEGLKEPEDLLDNLRNELLPGLEDRKENEKQKKAAYLRSLRDVDWSEHLSIVPEEIEREENQRKIEEALGPTASN